MKHHSKKTNANINRGVAVS